MVEGGACSAGMDTHAHVCVQISLNDAVSAATQLQTATQCGRVRPEWLSSDNVRFDDNSCLELTALRVLLQQARKDRWNIPLVTLPARCTWIRKLWESQLQSWLDNHINAFMFSATCPQCDGATEIAIGGKGRGAVCMVGTQTVHSRCGSIRLRPQYRPAAVSAAAAAAAATAAAAAFITIAAAPNAHTTAAAAACPLKVSIRV